MQFAACLHFIPERGRASLPLLAALVEWGKKTLAESPQTFDETDVYNDALRVLLHKLGYAKGYGRNVTFEWVNVYHRTAAILELMRVYVLLEKRKQWGKDDDFSKVVFTEEFLDSALKSVYVDSMLEFRELLK